MQTQSKSIQKLITFSPELYSLVMSKSKRIGVSFAEYIRVLLVNDIKEEVEAIEMVDEKTEKAIGQSLKDFKEGRYTTIKTEKDLKKFLGIV